MDPFGNLGRDDRSDVRQLMTRRIAVTARLVLVILVAAFLAPAPVAAHAEVVGSSPGRGEIVGGEISRVDIVFAEVITDASIKVIGPDGLLTGEMVQTEGLVVAFGLDEKISGEGDYRVVFEFDSIDDDFVELEFSFTYSESAPEPLPVVVGGVAKESTGLSTIAIVILATSTLGLAALLAWRYRQLASRRAQH